MTTGIFPTFLRIESSMFTKKVHRTLFTAQREALNAVGSYPRAGRRPLGLGPSTTRGAFRCLPVGAVTLARCDGAW